MLGRALVILSAAALAGSAWAQEPGSRIRSSPEVPQAMEPTIAPTPPEVKGCERLRAEQRERCLAVLRESTPGRPASGPEATGMANGSGAGATSAGSGATTGSAGFGGAAPR